MTLAKSTHRNHSLARRRPAERARVGRRRSAHRRPGAGFLPLRLPVARRSNAGYRIYSASDFFGGLDCEPLAAHSGLDGEPSPRRRPARPVQRLSLCTLALAGATAALTALATVAWMRTGRAGGRRVSSNTAHDEAALRPAVTARTDRSATRVRGSVRRLYAVPRAPTGHQRRRYAHVGQSGDAGHGAIDVARPARALVADPRTTPRASSPVRSLQPRRHLEFGFEK